MTALILLVIVIAYLGILFIISLITSKNVDNKNFFLGTRQVPWIIISLGMLGDSLSGVSFISVPGWVQSTSMTYLQMCLGFVVGYFAVAYILLPIYYKLKTPSIYSFLENRFGTTSYKTASVLFLISKISISALRFFIVVKILQILIFQELGIPFWATSLFFLAAIWAYSFKGGLKTLIWTDLLQSLLMFSVLVVTFILVSKKIDFTIVESIEYIINSPYSKIFEFRDWSSKQHFVKQFISGAFIVIVMTGLDQSIMQKNLTCKNLKDAKKNLLSYAWFFIPTNLILLSLGILLMYFAEINNINPELIMGDNLFPFLAQNYLGSGVLILFVIGLISVAFTSIDSAITTTTTSFCFDILKINNKGEEKIKKARFYTQIAISVLILLLLLFFYYQSNNTIIDVIYVVVGYTYGPLLGIFTFGIFTKINIKEKYVPIIAIISPLLCFFINKLSNIYLNYSFGYELLLLNGIITFTGLMIIKKKENKKA